MASNGGNSATENRPITEHRLAQGTTDAAMLRVHVEYSGHEGVRRRNFSTLVASSSPMARSGTQAQATRAITSLLWGASSPSAQAEPTPQPSVNAAVLAVEESLLAFWMMRGGGEEGDTSIAAFFRTASGLTWAPIGTARPTLGRELVNKELRDALAQKLEIDASEDGTNEKALQFTRGEWDRLGVRLDPGVNFFVKVGDFFFKPAENEGVPATLNAEELGTVVRETLGCDLDPAHDTSLLERPTLSEGAMKAWLRCRFPRYQVEQMLNRFPMHTVVLDHMLGTEHRADGLERFKKTTKNDLRRAVERSVPALVDGIYARIEAFHKVVAGGSVSNLKFAGDLGVGKTFEG